jgi:Transposase DDE domain
LYQTVFLELLARCQEVAHNGRRKFRFKNKLLSLDATVIDLCSTLYDWAKFRRTKGAMKLHLLRDHDGYLPRFAVITDGNTHELKVVRKLRWEPGNMVVFDRGYIDQWFVELTQQGSVLGDPAEGQHRLLGGGAAAGAGWGQGAGRRSYFVLWFARRRPGILLPPGGNLRSRD